MKQSLIILTITLLFIGGSASAQNSTMEDYFQKRGVAILANYAHPTNTFQAGTYTVTDDYVIVDILYEGGIETKLKVYRQGEGFSRVSVLEDTDFVDPFACVKFISDAILEQCKDSDAKNEIVRAFENSLNKTLREFSRTDWALLVIDLDYLANNN